MIASPLLSVVIPCYEQAHLLPRALDSVNRQHVEGLDLIVVDDGSVQDVRAVVAAHAPGARYVRQDNAGLAAARNRGLAEAQGAFVAFMDADDRFLDGGLRAGLRCMAAHPDALFVFGGYSNVAEDGCAARPPVRPAIGPLDFEALLRRNVIGMHGAVLYRRDALIGAGGFDPSLRSCEDYDLYLRLVRHGPAYAHAALVAEYLRHGGTLSGRPIQMIEYCLAALGKQRPQCSTGRLRRAYRAGVHHALAKYGFHILRSLLSGTDGGRSRQAAIHDLKTFMTRMPRWLLV